MDIVHCGFEPISRHIPFLLSKLLNESSIPGAVILGFEQQVQGLTIHRNGMLHIYFNPLVHVARHVNVLMASIPFRHATLRRVCHTVWRSIQERILSTSDPIPSTLWHRSQELHTLCFVPHIQRVTAGLRTKAIPSDHTFCSWSQVLLLQSIVLQHLCHLFHLLQAYIRIAFNAKPIISWVSMARLLSVRSENCNLLKSCWRNHWNQVCSGFVGYTRCSARGNGSAYAICISQKVYSIPSLSWWTYYITLKRIGVYFVFSPFMSQRNQIGLLIVIYSILSYIYITKLHILLNYIDGSMWVADVKRYARLIGSRACLLMADAWFPHVLAPEQSKKWQKIIKNFIK